MAINKEVAQVVIDWLEGGAIHVTEDGTNIGFDMNFWHDELEEYEYSSLENQQFPSECGTAMCIGGAINQFFNTGDDETNGSSGTHTDETLAATTLGLPYNQAQELFYPWECDWYESAGSPELSPLYMAGVMRRLVETGELIG